MGEEGGKEEGGKGTEGQASATHPEVFESRRPCNSMCIIVENAAIKRFLHCHLSCPWPWLVLDYVLIYFHPSFTCSLT